MQSIYPKPERRTRRVHSSVAIAALSTLTIALNRDALIEEHVLLFHYTEPFAPAPTGFLADEIARLIRSVKLIVTGPQGGTTFQLDGLSLFHHSQIREPSIPATAVLGANTTCDFMMELHYESDYARRDLLSALDASSATQVSLSIEFGDASDSALVFSGGVSAGAPSFGLEVLSQDIDANHFIDENGDLLAQYEGVASAVHFTQSIPAVSAGAGDVVVELQHGNMTRDIMLIIEDAAGTLSDAVVDNISLLIGGVERKVGSFLAFRQMTRTSLGMDVTGLCVLDWSDDEFGWLSLIDVQQAQLVLHFAAGGNARVIQNFVK